MTSLPQWPTKQCYMCLVPNGGHSPHCPNHCDNTALKEKLTEKSRQTTSGPCQDVEPGKKVLVVEGRIVDGSWSMHQENVDVEFCIHGWKNHKVSKLVQRGWSQNEWELEAVVLKPGTGEGQLYRCRVVDGPFENEQCLMDVFLVGQEKT